MFERICQSANEWNRTGSISMTEVMLMPTPLGIALRKLLRCPALTLTSIASALDLTHQQAAQFVEILHQKGLLLQYAREVGGTTHYFLHITTGARRRLVARRPQPVELDA